MNWLTRIFSSLWGYVALIGTAVATLALTYLKGQKAGRDAVEAKQAKKSRKIAKEANANRDKLRRLSDDALNKRLSKYARKK